jgi:hypothetical protein
MNNRFEEQPIDITSAAAIDQTIDQEDDKSIAVASLIERSNFYNIPELHDAATAIIEGLTDPDTDASQLKLAWVEYAKIAERIVESTDATHENPKSYAKAQVEAIIHKSLIFHSVGNTLRYLEELDRAEVYAYNEGLDQMSTVINNEITTTVESLSMSSEVLILRLKGIVSEENREFLRDLIDEGDDFEDMINHAYGMILEGGGDPDEIFAEMGII